jgi:hypothetical protein
VDAQQGCPVGQSHAQLFREAIQDCEQAGLVQHATSPSDVRGHGRAPLHQIGAPDRLGDSRVRRGLFTRQDIAVGIAAQHLYARQGPQQLKHLSRLRPEQDKVPQRPPPVHPEAIHVCQHCAQCHVVPVNIGDNS